MRLAVGALTSCTRWLDEDVDPLAGLGPGGFAWLRDGAGFATAGVAATVAVPPGPGRLARAAAEVDALLASIEVDDRVGAPGTGPVVVGALAFSDACPSELVVPARVVGRTPDGRCWETRIVATDGQGPAPNGPAALAPVPDPVPGPPPGSAATAAPAAAGVAGPAGFREAVARAVERIRAGTLDKVVLARQVVVEAPEQLDVARVVDRLRRDHPSCFTFAVGGFVGSTPELLARRRGDSVLSQPMAGSTRRGADPAEDARLAAALAASAKDLDEHAMVVDAVVRALGPVCEEVGVGRPEVVRLATVAHLASTVRGRLRAPAPSALALAGLLHPTPAVGGLPRAAALAAIADLERFDRGLYAGPVGWVDRRGDGEWAVALRCAHLDGTRAVLAAGAGIVAGSEPEAEWAETEAKLETMLAALAGGEPANQAGSQAAG